MRDMTMKIFAKRALAPIGLAVILAGLPAQAAQTVGAASGNATSAAATGAGLDRALLSTPPAPWAAQDPADSVYRAGRAALNGGNYARAAELFKRITDRYPRSTYAADAYYWRAYALYRAGGRTELQEALRALSTQRQQHPNASTSKDRAELATRIRGALAQLGDEESYMRLYADAQRAAANGGRRGGSGGSSGGGACSSEDDDMRAAALNALLQMDADRAVPMLRTVLARRDACSAQLRRKAVFLLSQKRTAETEDLLLAAARNDPDREVREQAVFWLSQVPGEKALTALEEILRSSADAGLQDKAIFALSQHQSERASRVLRDYAERENTPLKLREQAIFWIGQRNAENNADYLRELYGKLKEPKLREKVIFSLSQMQRSGNDQFLMDIAMNTAESMQLRKQALFWAGQMQSVSVARLVQLYDRIPDREMKEQLIFVYSQRNDAAAVDKMIDIARRESDRELRKKAVFWLSQSKDPRVADVLMELINQ